KRTTSTSTGSSTVLYFGQWLEASPSGLAKLYYAGNRVIARRDGVGLHFFHSDELGSMRLVTDGEGKTEGRPIDYSAFGSIVLGSVSVASGRAFDGGIQDAQSPPGAVGELDFLSARYYDPALGRFLTADDNPLALGDPQ